MSMTKWKKALSSALMAATLVGGMSACAAQREQSSVGEYVDDSVITTQIKAKFAADKAVSALAISVETLQGVVQLSGFAKSADEKQTAERLAQSVEGVKGVKNDIVLKP